MVHTPRVITVTELVFTAHTLAVTDAKLTASPEDAVALMLKGGVAKPRFASAANVIVWPRSAARTVKL